MADRPVFVREVAHLERPLILMRDEVEKAPHFVRHEAHCLHYVCGRAAHRIDPGFRFAEIRRLDPRNPGITTLCTTGPVLRRLARLGVIPPMSFSTVSKNSAARDRVR